jgi:hypothetical protein
MVMRVPLLVNPAGAPPLSEWEPVETVVISLHGGMIRTRRRFPVGTTIDIRMRQTQRSTQGRVVWSAGFARASTREIGFEFLEPPGFWEVHFPAGRVPEDALPTPASQPRADEEPSCQNTGSC